MPYIIRKLPGSSKVRVYENYGTSKSKIVAKETSRKKAESQVRLLRGVEHGWKPSR